MRCDRLFHEHITIPLLSAGLVGLVFVGMRDAGATR